MGKLYGPITSFSFLHELFHAEFRELYLCYCRFLDYMKEICNNQIIC